VLTSRAINRWRAHRRTITELDRRRVVLAGTCGPAGIAGRAGVAMLPRAPGKWCHLVPRVSASLKSFGGGGARSGHASHPSAPGSGHRIDGNQLHRAADFRSRRMAAASRRLASAHERLTRDGRCRPFGRPGSRTSRRIRPASRPAVRSRLRRPARCRSPATTDYPPDHPDSGARCAPPGHC